MFATIHVRKDDSFETICFRSENDAKRFQHFVLAYMRESGAGNGYGAYWIFDLDIGLYKNIPSGSTARLDAERLQSMLRSILQARTAVDDPAAAGVSVPLTTEGGESIRFELGALPPRQRPTVGDMFRVVSTEADAEERRVGEGRVLMDLDNVFTVIDSWDEKDGGAFKADATWYRVRADRVMKISDWKKQRRGDKPLVLPTIATSQQLRAVGIKAGDRVRVAVCGPGQVVDGAEFLGELPGESGIRVRIPARDEPVDLPWGDVTELRPATT